MSGNILVAIAHGIETYFVSVIKGLAGQALTDAKHFVSSFIKEDVGKDAYAAVEYAQTLTDASGPEKREAAKEKLIQALKDSGKDIADFAEHELNWFIETALVAFKSKIAATTSVESPSPAGQSVPGTASAK